MLMACYLIDLKIYASVALERKTYSESEENSTIQHQNVKQNCSKTDWTCYNAIPSTKPCCSCNRSGERQWLRPSQKVCQPRKTCFCNDSKLIETKCIKYQTRGSYIDQVPMRSTGAMTDELDVIKLQEDLANEKRLRAKLEEQLDNLTCSLQCLKSDSEQVSRLQDALAKAEEQTKLAIRSRNLAMDLAKQSRDHTDMIAASKAEMSNQLCILQEENCKLAGEAEKSVCLSKQLSKAICDNTKLLCECKDMQYKLKSMSDDEAKKCQEVADEVNKMKDTLQRTHDALRAEKSELEITVSELTKVVKTQQVQVNELSCLLDQQQNSLRESEICMSEKNALICELESKLHAMSLEMKDLKSGISNAKMSCSKESQICKELRKELEVNRDNHRCQLKIKEKIIEDQDDTIRKLKKIVHKSEKMAKQAAYEFEQLTDQLYCEKERNNCLRNALEAAESQLSDPVSPSCGCCEELKNHLARLEEQKNKALVVAKLATEKFVASKKAYRKQLQYEKQQQHLLTTLLQERDQEIQCLQTECQYGRLLVPERLA